MSDKYLVTCDGSPASNRALAFAIGQAKLCGASILLVHVLEWSPYSFLTPEEIEERHKRRTDELKRAEQAVIAPLAETVKAAGIEIETMIKYGHVTQTIADVAASEGVTQMFVGRSGHGKLASIVFGSTAAAMAQIAPVPCTIVP